jgi:hypothetical protein
LISVSLDVPEVGDMIVRTPEIRFPNAEWKNGAARMFLVFTGVGNVELEYLIAFSVGRNAV